MTAMELAIFCFNKEDETVLMNYFRTGHKFIARVAIKTTLDKGFEHVQQGDAIMTRPRLAGRRLWTSPVLQLFQSSHTIEIAIILPRTYRLDF
jgi:hypothetical protein